MRVVFFRTAGRAGDPKVHDQCVAIASIMMLAGLRSRCTTPALCASTRPATTCSAMMRIAGASAAVAQREERREVEAVDVHIVMYLMPLISPRSWMRTTFLWVTCRDSSSSRLKRRSMSAATIGSRSVRTNHFQRDATSSSASHA